MYSKAGGACGKVHGLVLYLIEFLGGEIGAPI